MDPAPEEPSRASQPPPRGRAASTKRPPARRTLDAAADREHPGARSGGRPVGGSVHWLPDAPSAADRAGRTDASADRTHRGEPADSPSYCAPTQRLTGHPTNAAPYRSRRTPPQRAATSEQWASRGTSNRGTCRASLARSLNGRPEGEPDERHRETSWTEPTADEARLRETRATTNRPPGPAGQRRAQVPPKDCGAEGRRLQLRGSRTKGQLAATEVSDRPEEREMNRNACDPNGQRTEPRMKGPPAGQTVLQVEESLTPPQTERAPDGPRGSRASKENACRLNGQRREQGAEESPVTAEKTEASPDRRLAEPHAARARAQPTP